MKKWHSISFSHAYLPQPLQTTRISPLSYDVKSVLCIVTLDHLHQTDKFEVMQRRNTFGLVNTLKLGCHCTAAPFVRAIPSKTYRFENLVFHFTLNYWQDARNKSKYKASNLAKTFEVQFFARYVENSSSSIGHFSGVQSDRSSVLSYGGFHESETCPQGHQK